MESLEPEHVQAHILELEIWQALESQYRLR